MIGKLSLRSKAILFWIVLFAATVMLLPLTVDTEDGTIVGEVRGDLSATGNITAQQHFSDHAFGATARDYVVEDSSLTAEVGGVSQILVVERVDGDERERWFNHTEGKDIEIHIEDGTLLCLFSEADVDCSLRSFKGIDAQGYYYIETVFSRMVLEGIVEHGSHESYDMRVSNGTLKVDEETYGIDGDVFFPNSSTIELTVSGYGKVSLGNVPDVRIDGSLVIESFTSLHPLLVTKDYSIEGEGIALRTLEEPDLDNDPSAYWTVEVESQELEEEINYISLLLFALSLSLLVFSIALLLTYSVRSSRRNTPGMYSEDAGGPILIILLLDAMYVLLLGIQLSSSYGPFANEDAVRFIENAHMVCCGAYYLVLSLMMVLILLISPRSRIKWLPLAGSAFPFLVILPFLLNEIWMGLFVILLTVPSVSLISKLAVYMWDDGRRLKEGTRDGTL